MVSRLCIDRLRAAKVEREAYAGPWLPEPWLGGGETADDRPDRRQDRADDLSVAFLLVLERLGPEERAAFLLHDVFDIGYATIAAALNKSEPASRQIVHRARHRVRTDRPTHRASDAERRHLLDRFMAASTAGDEQQILALLAPDATLSSDGGGNARTALNVIRGAARIARLFASVVRKRPDTPSHRAITANGQPAVATLVDGQVAAVTSVAVSDGRIVAVYRVVNPDKLRGFAVADAPD